MVRIIIPPGRSFQIGGETISGPFEICLESTALTVAASTVEVQSGEWLIVGASSQAVQTLPYLREEMAIAFPVCVVLAAMIGLTWLRKVI